VRTSSRPRYKNTTLCSTLQRTATHLHHSATHCAHQELSPPRTYRTLQHTAIRCNALQQTTKRHSILKRTATHLQHTCNTLCTPGADSATNLQNPAAHCNTLQRTATYCKMLQHTATHLQHTCNILCTPEADSTTKLLASQKPFSVFMHFRTSKDKWSLNIKSTSTAVTHLDYTHTFSVYPDYKQKFSVYPQDVFFALVDLVNAVKTGTNYDINGLRPIYDIYRSLKIGDFCSSAQLMRAIGERLPEHGSSSTTQKTELSEEEGCSSKKESQPMTKKQKNNHLWVDPVQRCHPLKEYDALVKRTELLI